MKLLERRLSNSKNIRLKDSPCVRNCCLDASDICVGCYRHLDEITGWQSYSSLEKEKIIQVCQQRRIDSKNNS
ncbi:DUF1289 domain-containing protein [Colwellia sp. E2M01]|uniref:DUF1289 domain-containing protein n=1 Tax=Colwellia sp. E2M01 TaxID=2841561 RepID=UPI001C0999CA|nr:DUF1289 domain-containing protein [Colwellia sp. E2M01]MBU2871208.1 DUF1289 domain-containing protein [Colwellia sp. E2M01]